jgi:hypothetical protein
MRHRAADQDCATQQDGQPHRDPNRHLSLLFLWLKLGVEGEKAATILSSENRSRITGSFMVAAG